MKFIQVFAVILALVLAPAAACADVLKLGTTTTTEDSGLLAWLIPAYEKFSGDTLQVSLGGTGQVLKYGRNGDVDAVLSHSKSDEEKFVADGFAAARFEVMYNDFVIVGPSNDPAKIRGLTNPQRAFENILRAKFPFVSRADESGTHRAEQTIWRKANLQPDGAWYLRAGTGMAETLRIAHERGAYVLCDRATFLKYRKSLDLALLVTGEPKIANQYAAMAVNAKKLPGVNQRAAERFVAWLVSAQGQAGIAAFRIDGQQVFFPNAKPGK